MLEKRKGLVLSFSSVVVFIWKYKWELNITEEKWERKTPLLTDISRAYRTLSEPALLKKEFARSFSWQYRTAHAHKWSYNLQVWQILTHSTIPAVLMMHGLQWIVSGSLQVDSSHILKHSLFKRSSRKRLLKRQFTFVYRHNKKCAYACRYDRLQRRKMAKRSLQICFAPCLVGTARLTDVGVGMKGELSYILLRVSQTCFDVLYCRVSNKIHTSVYTGGLSKGLKYNETFPGQHRLFSG